MNIWIDSEKAVLIDSGSCVGVTAAHPMSIFLAKHIFTVYNQISGKTEEKSYSFNIPRELDLKNQ